MAIPPGRAGGAPAPADPRRTGRRTARRSIRGALAGAAATAVLLGLAVPAAASAAQPAPPLQERRIGAAPTAPADALPADGPADSTPLSLSITLDPRDPGALQSFVTAVSTPGSPQYRQYLKTGEFARTFGADPAAIASVTRALADAGLHPGAPDANGLTIPVATTVGEAKRAFATGFSGYRLADGSTAYANTEAPLLSGAAAGAVAGVVGLNNLVRPHTSHILTDHGAVKPEQPATAVAPAFNGGQPALCADIENWQAAQGKHKFQDYFTPDTLAGVYQKSFAGGGAGSTVAVFALEDYSDAAVAAYQRCFATAAPVSRVKVNGGPTTPVTPDNYLNVGVETELDVETIIGFVPNASVLVYQGPDYTRASWADILAVYQRIVADNRAQVVSVSWGSCEDRTDRAYQQAANLVYQQAAAQGQSVVAASGDYGSTGCFNGDPTRPDSRLSAPDPAGQPYVTGIGGTTINGTPAAPQETAWNSGGGASGGGLSSRWALDNTANYQAGRTAPGFNPNGCPAVQGVSTCRQVPDVSALADSGRGYLISVYAQDRTEYWGTVGGTSGAAPLWAAIIAHANADARCAASGPVGYLNPLLYRLGADALKDVTTGHTNVTASGYSGGLYTAAPGYDMATGLGTPRVDALTRELCAALPQSPAGTYRSTGPTRLLDTRADSSPVAAYGERSLQISGSAGIPATGVTAVILNVTATAPATDGHLTVYPSGGARPDTSNLNWTAGTTVPNLVTVPVGKDGRVTFYNGAWGGVHLLADVQGYYTSATDGATYRPSGPARVLDTRTSGGPVGAYGEVALSSQQLGAPAGARAVVLNVTSTGSQEEGHLTVYPSGDTLPVTSNLNWTRGQTIPNQVIVPLGADGGIRLYNGSWGSTQMVADVFGFLTADGGAAFHTTAPHRLMDSRLGLGTPQGAFTGRQVRRLGLDGGGLLSGARAVVLNVTVTNPLEDGHLAVSPAGRDSGSTSNLNWRAGQTVANMVTVPVGADGALDILNGSWNNADVIVDVLGYYS
ncbi:protease pro-enzyme activation domain-containing protein [Kitasatospora sp. NPDC048239]|uniref:S53 family peptidase n=1 Tax=Kitasatospora sp. NPDC048239 TaxID=3364046 RepID=UPI00371E17B2